MICRWKIALICFLLCFAAGCGTLGLQSGGSAIPATEQKTEGGLLLRTGSIQLGSGIGQNAYSWQGGPHPGL
jgi:hypothetical protein